MPSFTAISFLETSDQYYRDPSAYMSSMEKYGFTRDETSRSSDQANETGANPTCKEVWLGEDGGGILGGASGLRDDILDEISILNQFDIRWNWEDWGGDLLLPSDATTQDKDDLLVRMVIDANAAKVQSKTNVDLSNDFDVDASAMSKVLDNAYEFLGIGDGISEFFKANAIRYTVKLVGPMLLSLIQMIVIMSSCIVMLLGGYRFSAFLSVALAYFAFEFINVIWAASFWFDSRVMEIFTTQYNRLANPTTTFLIMATSSAAIVVLPMIWLAVIASAGAGMVRGMGSGGAGGGTAAAAFKISTGAKAAKYLKKKWDGK